MSMCTCAFDGMVVPRVLGFRGDEDVRAKLADGEGGDMAQRVSQISRR